MTTQEKALDMLKKKAKKSNKEENNITATTNADSVPATFEGVNSNGIKKILTVYQDAIADVIPKHLTPERVIQIASVTAARNPKLKKCTSESIIAAVIAAASLGLDPTPQLGLCAFIPRKNKYNNYRLECTFEFQYKGLANLAWRTGIVKSMKTAVVREKDTFSHSTGIDEKIDHILYDGDDFPGEIKKTYAIIHFTTGGYIVEIMNKWQVMQHKDFAEAGKSPSSPWNSKMNEHWQWRKTVLKQALKLAPVSIEYQKQIAMDEQIIPMDAVNRSRGKIDIELLGDVDTKMIENVDTETGEVIETADAPKMNTDTKEPALFN